MVSSLCCTNCASMSLGYGCQNILCFCHSKIELETHLNIPHFTLKGLDPDMPTVTNSKGGKQSDTPYGLRYVPPVAILKVSEVLKKGAEKYGGRNWTNIEIEDHLNHALQHIFAYLAGDRSDNHLANLSCRSLFALELQELAKVAEQEVKS